MLGKADPPIIAANAGLYREEPVFGRLAVHFSCAWSHILSAGIKGRMIVVPDGCVDLVWANGRLIVVGPDRTAAFPTLDRGQAIFGLRFHPGAALLWLGVPISEFVDQSIPLDAIWGARANHAEDRIVNAGTVAERRAVFHQAVTSGADELMPASGEMPALFRHLGHADPRRASLRTFMDKTGMTERTLRRHSHENFGYGPKTLERILRFQRFLRLGRIQPHLDLAALAIDAGYADQPHMNRETKVLSDLTPAALTAQLAGRR